MKKLINLIFVLLALGVFSTAHANDPEPGEAESSVGERSDEDVDCIEIMDQNGDEGSNLEDDESESGDSSVRGA